MFLFGADLSLLFDDPGGFRGIFTEDTDQVYPRGAARKREFMFHLIGYTGGNDLLPFHVIDFHADFLRRIISAKDQGKCTAGRVWIDAEKRLASQHGLVCSAHCGGGNGR